MSKSESEILLSVELAFQAEPRPEHFTDYKHCCECYEHDELLRARDRATLHLEDVNNPGWDPICFLSEQGWRYYLPALARLAFESAGAQDWYLSQLLFHLIYDGKENRRVVCCTPTQRSAIAAMLWYFVETAQEKIVEYNMENDMQAAIEIWSESESEEK